MPWDEATRRTVAQAKLLLRHQDDVDGYREVKEAVVDLTNMIEGFVTQLWGTPEGKEALKQRRDKKRRAEAKRLGIDPGPDLSKLSARDRKKVQTTGGIYVPGKPAAPKEEEAPIFVG